MRIISTALLFFILNGSLLAQKDCPCCSKDDRAFDFWIGHWIVKDTAGKVVGENTISAIEDGCALQEKWKGKSGSTGTSLNYYDKTDSTWNQVWADNSGGILRLKGNWKNGAMIMLSEIQNSQSHGNFLNRVTWTPVDNGTVIQNWDLVNANEETIKTVFYGVYHKRK